MFDTAYDYWKGSTINIKRKEKKRNMKKKKKQADK